MSFYHPITVQIQDENTLEWSNKWNLHARVNKAGGGQAFNAGADQYTTTLTFEVRYFEGLEDMRYSPQLYRVLYRGHKFKLVDWDDFMEQHRTVKLVGAAYG
jgi:head-tail adaptor